MDQFDQLFVLLRQLPLPTSGTPTNNRLSQILGLRRLFPTKADNIRTQVRQLVDNITNDVNNKLPTATSEDCNELFSKIEHAITQFQGEADAIKPFFKLGRDILHTAALRGIRNHTSFFYDVLPVEKICGISSGEDVQPHCDRHPIDPRFTGHIGQKFFTLQPTRKRLDCSCHSVLSATYPYIENATGEKVLLNDPNADGFVSVIFPGMTIGAVADGSGSGERAWLASNLALSAVYDATISATGDLEHPLRRLKTTEDGLKFLLDVVARAQRNILSMENAGATTACFYLLAKLAESKTSTHVLMYIVVGDVELLWYDRQTGSWSSLVHSSYTEGIRLNTATTPGGLGRSWGTETTLYGYGNLDGQDRQLDWLPTNAAENRRTNLHFGILECFADDMFIFSTDGLGDTLDPVQLYANPAACSLDEDVSWARYAKKGRNGKKAVDKLRKDVINHVLSGLTTPLEIADGCVKHATTVTHGTREVYENKLDRDALLEEWMRNHPSENTDKIPPFAPFAKMDHLGLQVVRADLVDGVK